MPHTVMMPMNNDASYCDDANCDDAFNGITVSWPVLQENGSAGTTTHAYTHTRTFARACTRRPFRVRVHGMVRLSYVCLWCSCRMCVYGAAVVCVSMVQLSYVCLLCGCRMRLLLGIRRHVAHLCVYACVPEGLRALICAIRCACIDAYVCVDEDVHTKGKCARVLRGLGFRVYPKP